MMFDQGVENCQNFDPLADVRTLHVVHMVHIRYHYSDPPLRALGD
jgi:hypothetical protein